MKYSKLMIIIENTKVKIEKEEEIKQTTDFFLEGGSGPSNNKIAFLKQKLHERQQKMIKKLSKTNDIGKFFPKPFQGSTANFNIARDASFLLINSASFEIDNQALKDRSYSMVLKTSYTEENTKPDSNFISQAKIKSITDLNPLKDNYKSPKLSNSQKIKKEEKITAISSNDKEKKNFFGRSNTEFFKRDDLDDINTERKTEQIVVNKRFMYYDDEGD